MKMKLIDKTGKSVDVEMPKNFSSRIRKDILAKAFEASKFGQAYGAKPALVRVILLLESQ